MDTRDRRTEPRPPANDEVVEIFDGEEPAAPDESWADLLPPTVDAAPGDGAWAPPPAAPRPPAPEALPTAEPFDWAAIDLPPPPAVPGPVPPEPATELEDEVEVFDVPPEEAAPLVAPAAASVPPAPVPLPAPETPNGPEAPAVAAAAVPGPAPAKAVPLRRADRAPEAARRPFDASVAPEGEDVLSLVSPPAPLSPAPERRPTREIDRLVAGARELFALGDFTGSLELLGQALAIDPRHPEALAYHERTQDTLVQMYESKLGRLSRTPRVLLQPDEIVWLNLDHRAGFILAQIDGQVTIEDVFALSGMSRLDTAKILVELIEQGAIAS